jgi:uncharacterized protein YycO
MKRKVIFFFLLAFAGFFLLRAAYFMVCNATYQPTTGDIIFHVSKSYQSTAIKIGTLSRYSHCGIVVVENGKPYVIEAEGGVEKTPMKTWLRRGRMFHHYRVMRLKNNHPISVPYTLGGMYDRYFRFNNGMYYCSELVWEIYKKNGITLCKPNPLGDYYFLNIPLVQKHIKSRDLTLDQKVVPPSDLRYSRYLRTVSYGYFSPFWL